MSARLLTKSRFKIGYDCPTKLYFLDDKKYGNANEENAFLRSLAEGGFQVGELAKMYCEGGHEIHTLDKTEALKQTNELLKLADVTIYEAAVQFGQLFIRADILIKRGTDVQLVEVKAKGFDPTTANPFYTKSSVKKGEPEVTSEWEPYLIDADLISKARSAGFALHFSHQSIGDVIEVSPGFLNRITDNAATKIVLRINDPDSAEFFSRSFGTKNIQKTTQRITNTKNIDRAEVVGEGTTRDAHQFRASPDLLKTLPTGVGAVLVAHGQATPHGASSVFTVRFPALNG